MTSDGTTLVNNWDVRIAEPKSTTEGLTTVTSRISHASNFEYPRLSDARSIGIILTMNLGLIASTMSMLAVSIAMPQMQKDLDIVAGDLQWLSGAFTLTYGAFLLLFGRIADIYGHKSLFLLGTFWLGIWSLACALARTSLSLYIFRAFAGIGAAAMSPAMFGILGRSFAPGPWKSAAFAAFSAGAPLGAAVGLLVGGFMTAGTPASWRSFFYLNLGLAVTLAAVALLVIPSDPPLSTVTDRRVDWIGAALVVSGLVLFIFAMADSSSAPQGWKTPYIPTLLVVSLFLLAAFYWWEARLEILENEGGCPPLMRLDLFRRGKFALVQLVAALVWSAFVDEIFFIVLYYQEYKGFSAIQCALRFIPFVIIGVVINCVMGFAAATVPAQYLLLLGTLGTAISTILFAAVDPDATYWTYNLWASMLSVFGADFVFATSTMYGSKIARSSEQGIAGSIFQTITQVSSIFGLSICTIVQVHVTQKESRQLGLDIPESLVGAPLSAYLVGLRATFWTCTAFALLASAVSLVGLRGMGMVGSSKPHDPPAQEDDEAITEKKLSGPASTSSACPEPKS